MKITVPILKVLADLGKENNRFTLLNNKYHFQTNDALVVIKLHTKPNENMDFSKPKVIIKKFSVSQWSGKIYINFEASGIDRTKSNIPIGDITVDVKKSDSFLKKMFKKVAYGEDDPEDPGLLQKALGLFGQKHASLDSKIRVSIDFDDDLANDGELKLDEPKNEKKEGKEK